MEKYWYNSKYDHGKNTKVHSFLKQLFMDKIKLELKNCKMNMQVPKDNTLLIQGGSGLGKCDIVIILISIKYNFKRKVELKYLTSKIAIEYKTIMN